VVGVVSFEHDEAELETAALGLFAELDWATANAYGEMFPGGMLGREHPGEVVLRDRLNAAVARLNPNVPDSARMDGIEQLVLLRPPEPEVRNNQDAWNLLRDGARVEVDDGGLEGRFIDWDDPSSNEWLAVRQFKVMGELSRTVSAAAAVVLNIRGVVRARTNVRGVRLRSKMTSTRPFSTTLREMRTPTYVRHPKQTAKLRASTRRCRVYATPTRRRYSSWASWSAWAPV
jgi:hypothetical protein